MSSGLTWCRGHRSAARQDLRARHLLLLALVALCQAFTDKVKRPVGTDKVKLANICGPGTFCASRMRYDRHDHELFLNMVHVASQRRSPRSAGQAPPAARPGGPLPGVHRR